MTQNPETPRPLTEEELDAEMARIMGGNAIATSLHEQVAQAEQAGTLDTPDLTEKLKMPVEISDEDIAALIENETR